MGRVKLKIKRLESTSNRQVTYSKRRNGILKKARELSILCDIEIILLMFSPTGRPTLFHGARSNIEEVIAKFAQLTPQERAKRKLESLEALKKTFKKLDHDVNLQDFLGASTRTIEELTNQARLLQAQLTEVHKRLSSWSNPDKVDSTEHLRQMEDSLRESLNRIRVHKEPDNETSRKDQIWIHVRRIKTHNQGVPRRDPLVKKSNSLDFWVSRLVCFCLNLCCFLAIFPCSTLGTKLSCDGEKAQPLFTSDPELMPILAGTLVAACYGCEQNKGVVQQEVSMDMLLSLLRSCRNALPGVRSNSILDSTRMDDSSECNTVGPESRKLLMDVSLRPSRHNARSTRGILGKGVASGNSLRLGKMRNQRDSKGLKTCEEMALKHNMQAPETPSALMLYFRFPSSFMDRAEQFFSAGTGSVGEEV